jgi:hypothetical protein
MDRLIASRQSLAEALRAHGLVPILGPEVVLVEGVQGTPGSVPFYRLVADELLRTYSTSLPEPAYEGSGSSWLLHRAVAQVLAENRDASTERVRRSVSAIVKSLSSPALSTPLLDRLAGLGAFDVFISLTPDDFLVEALRRVLGADKVEVGAYAPNADSSQPVDLLPPRPGVARVFFPLGRSATGTRLAIHEEDALEYLYKFQEEGPRRAPNLLTELRTHDLLLLGCNLPDWLGRGFLRLANENRLSSQDKKMEFFAADAQDPALNSFLTRFDPNASVFPWSPQQFIEELETLVPKQPGAAAPPAIPARAPAAATAPGGGRPTVFVSYASEDAAAAQLLARALMTLGFADVWLDKRKLIAGDDWSDRIDDAIKHCDFFLPVLSRQADQRREGVFWEEWRKAIDRALRVNDAFLLPTGIDATPPASSGYGRISSGFTSGFFDLHLLHAPGGQLSEPDKAQLSERCKRFREASGG